MSPRRLRLVSVEGSATRSFRLIHHALQVVVHLHRARQHLLAQRHRLVQVRQRGAQVADARLQQAREVGELGEERLLHRQRAEARLERRRPVRDRVSQGLRIGRDRAEGDRTVRELLRVVHSDRGDDARRVGELREEANQLRRGIRQGGRDRPQVREQRVESRDRLVQGGAAGGEGVAEAHQDPAAVLPGGGVECVVDVVELDLLLRLGKGDGPSGRHPGFAGAARDLEVLEPERRAVAHPDRRVGGQGFGALVELQVELRHRRCARAVRGLAAAVGRRRHGVDRLHGADPVSADPHLVVGTEACRVAELSRNLVSGDEGEPVVGVVGEEHGHEHDQRRDRADHRRRGSQRAHSSAAVHRRPTRYVGSIAVIARGGS